MNLNQAKPQHISLLLAEIANQTVKVTLTPDKKLNESARVILYLPAGSEVYEHSHAAEKNGASEVYIDLRDYVLNGLAKMQTKPEVAGSNSPTGRILHSITKSDKPQVYLAIKRGQEQNAWQDLSQNLPAYLKALNIQCSLTKEGVLTIELPVTVDKVTRKETVVIDLVNQTIAYENTRSDKVAHRDDEKESSSFAKLTKQQKDLGIEK